MAVFQATDPATGQTLEIEGDSSPTEAELEQIFANIQPAVPVEPVSQIPQQPTGIPASAFGALSQFQQPAARPGGGAFIEPITTVATGAIAEPIAGIAGLISAPFVGAERAAGIVRGVQEAGTFQPRTEAGREVLGTVGGAIESIFGLVPESIRNLPEATLRATGSPALAALVETLPVAAVEIFGLKGVGKLRGVKETTGIPDDVADEITGIRGDVPENIDRQGVIIDELPEETIAGIQEQTRQRADQAASTERSGVTIEDLPEEELRVEVKLEVKPEFSSVASKEADLEDVSDILAKGQIKEAVAAADVDPVILDSAEKLGIDIPTSSASQNRAFVEAAQAAKSQPQSKLSIEEATAIQQTRDVVDNFIRDLRGGDLSVAGFDDNLGKQFDTQIKSLQQASNKAYNIVNRAIPANTPIDLSDSRGFINSRIDDLGGDKTLLEPPEKQLLRLVERAEQGDLVTYGALDRVRKSVGEGFNNQGVFKDSGDTILSEVYASLSNDQQRIADSLKVGNAYKEARGLVSQRKDIEKAATKLFGRELDKSLLPKLEGAARNLIKGNTKDFKKLMASIPKEFRGDAAGIVLDNIFGSGARTATGLSEGFVSAFQKLNRNKEAKSLLFTFLPRESANTFNDIGNVWTGLIRSKALENKSKTARDILAALDNGSAAGRVLGFGAKVVAAEGVGTLTGFPLVGTAAVTVSALKTKKRSAIKKADDFITSPEFSQAVKTAASGGKNADEILSKSSKFKAWLNTLSKPDRDAINTDGFISWLSAPLVVAPGAVEAIREEQK